MFCKSDNCIPAADDCPELVAPPVVGRDDSLVAALTTAGVEAGVCGAGVETCELVLDAAERPVAAPSNEARLAADPMPPTPPKTDINCWGDILLSSP